MFDANLSAFKASANGERLHSDLLYINKICKCSASRKPLVDDFQDFPYELTAVVVSNSASLAF